MTFNDDAELTAIAVVRLALTEHGADPGSEALQALIQAMYDQHGPEGAATLVAALGRLAATILEAFVPADRDLSKVLDDHEMHKLRQHFSRGEGA